MGLTHLVFPFFIIYFLADIVLTPFLFPFYLIFPLSFEDLKAVYRHFLTNAIQLMGIFVKEIPLPVIISSAMDSEKIKG